MWSVKAGDEVVFPEAGDTQPEPGEWGVVFLLAAEAGDIEVDYEGSVGEWPSTHEYHYQRECDGLPDPTVTQPTCDVATGKVVIPAPDPQLIGGLEFKLDGEVVEPGSTHNVEPGTHTITLVVDDDALPTVLGAQKVSESVEFPTELVIKTWVIEITAPSCPDLPNTGSRTGLIAGVAVALLIVGSGLLVFGRRRRVTNAG